ncbi:glutamate synthase large subunit [Clostridium tertium]|uniref:Glutamate synthase [NADPH] large chain n=1 Tax=Clostridium tertium TaxID=1559 RepID=A0A6N2YI68_9CLOT
MKGGITLHKDIGLYRSSFEHDACGIGAVVNIDGKKNHKAIQDALEILVNLEHRGGTDADGQTGDGSGLLIQIPHNFFKEEAKNIGIDLSKEGDYAIGMFFLPPSSKDSEEAIIEFTSLSKEEGLKILGWREVPINKEVIGEKALKSMPIIRQVIIEKPNNISDYKEFERKLYILRRRFEKKTQHLDVYISSLSSKTLVYKGLLLASQLRDFYLDLSDVKVVSAIAMVHSRYSTNTVPSWKRAHPNRYIIHNGEINTLRGNINSLYAREGSLKSKDLGNELSKVLPIINSEGSDSAILDNTLEFLIMNGFSIEEAIMMLVPEPWEKNDLINEDEKAYFEFNATRMEPWDGPMAIIFTDGDVMGATLDRNGLRPARYYLTKDNNLIISSEVGALNINMAEVVEKGRLTPGKILLVDTINKKFITNSELKKKYYNKHNYKQWVDDNIYKIEDLNLDNKVDIEKYSGSKIDELFKIFDYSFENLKNTILPMSENGEESLSAMGIDTPLPVLSNKSILLFNYFKQLFAQVTNPPIDAIREDIVVSTTVYLGGYGNVLGEFNENLPHLKFSSPIISNEDLAKIKCLKERNLKTKVVSILYRNDVNLEKALKNLMTDVEKSYNKGFNIIVLSDRGTDKYNYAIPSLLALAAVHHYLIRKGIRSNIDLVVESAEPREIHHFATLIGYGAVLVNPYLAYEGINRLKEYKLLNKDYDTAVIKYNKAIVKGLVKIISKMGISTIQSYRGAQIFEAVGLSKDIIDKYFTNTVSRIEGLNISEIEKEYMLRHNKAFEESKVNFEFSLDSSGYDKYRQGKEEHLYNPLTIYKLQQATKSGDYNLFKEYSKLIDSEDNYITIRSLLDFNYENKPVPIEEVESTLSIVKRFKTGAMSYGSISKEAHEALAIAMNRLGGKSNTGEGGEDSERFKVDKNGDLRRSSIKQIASGRFGVTSEYLVNADELQIKMAQGAKPGEGGQLPGKKVYPWIAKTRGSTTGVGLISPPPHHDIYSIEDLAQLIYDLKQSNEKAKISVKLVAEAGVGTIASGVAKAGANTILISGHDGGTGASPKTSIQSAGLPWELGLAETHQTLILNGLRDRVKIETDGKLMTGKDVAIAALLGAEEFGFATAPLVSLGCVMMRVCNLDTCPVGIATQNKELRKRFSGKPEYVVNFMLFIAEELREYMAKLGFRTIDEMVGRFDLLKQKESVKGYKRNKVDLSSILVNEPIFFKEGNKFNSSYKEKLDKTLDRNVLIPYIKEKMETSEQINLSLVISNTDRTFGTLLGSYITSNYSGREFKEDFIKIKCTGFGGQSLGAFIPKGITIKVNGDCNDYLGKGLSGGKIVVKNNTPNLQEEKDNVIIGNVALYGATSGKVFIAGGAGERFCVRNSGATAVVEGVGDNALEYMTGGTVAILGECGINIAAGMSGGIAYIYNKDNKLDKKINKELIDIEDLKSGDLNELKSLIKEHVHETESKLGNNLLENWDNESNNFIKIIPRDYKAILDLIEEKKNEGLNYEDALLNAFYERSAM